MANHNILIVEDEPAIRSTLKKFLENNHYQVRDTGSFKDAIKHDLTAFSLIITNLRLPDASGTDLISLAAHVPVVVVSAQASLRSAVQTMKLGAADYIAKPYDFDELLETVRSLTSRENAFFSTVEILGNCPSISDLNDRLHKVAPTDTNVLIEGESGTGKELVAKKLHLLSGRSDRQMISLNCAAIPAATIESKLFGYEPSGPEKHHTNEHRFAGVGLVEAANGSTLFLDQIGELPLDAQARLLRLIQEGEARRVGSSETRKVSVRIIASTHQNLVALVDQGAFREDLYYRLNVVRFELPALRDRGSDIELLARHFLMTYSERYAKTKLKLSDAALRKVKTYNWPGNIRELENALQRAVILCDEKLISPELLAIDQPRAVKIPNNDFADTQVSLDDYFQNFVLENEDHMTETEIAQKLGISRKSLWQKRYKFGIPRKQSKNQERPTTTPETRRSL